MTYGELGRKATAFAAYLQSIGVKPGERVAIMLPNTFQYPVSLFGVLKAGAVVVNVNPLYTVRELAHQLKDSGAQTIIVFENFAKTVQDALPGTKIQNVIVTGLGDLLADGLNIKGRLLNFMLRHVKKMVPAYQLPQAVPLLKALAVGYARPLTTGSPDASRHRVSSVHRRNHGRREGRDAHASQHHRQSAAGEGVVRRSIERRDRNGAHAAAALSHLFADGERADLHGTRRAQHPDRESARHEARDDDHPPREVYRHDRGQYAVQRVSRERGISASATSPTSSSRWRAAWRRKGRWPSASRR